ncbi:MAG: Ig-like domain-containing protein [Candidatus Poribacteria bacterium]|nr:Ig-like domain-containing protein [Candidatus Poribacteria bacterium]
MFSNKLTYPFVFAVLLIAGLAFVATPAPAQVVPVLSVTDELADVNGEPNTIGIQVYGIRAEPVSFELTITFPEAVTGLGASDIELRAADIVDGKNIAVQNGATASGFPAPNVSPKAVYEIKITATSLVDKVWIILKQNAVGTRIELDNQGQPISGTQYPTGNETLLVNILRSAAPPLTVSPDKSIGGNAPFTVTLTSTTAITLTRADIKVVGGSIDSLTPDAARRVWTVAIRPGVGITQITVEPSSNGSYIFPKGTFTVDTTGPVATITGTPPVGGGVFPITITFDEPLQTGAALIPNEVTVIGGSITALFAIPNTNSYVATLTPNPSAATVTVQVNANAVTDAGGVQNAATPSPAHSFQVASTAGPPGTTLGRGNVTISEIMFATDGGTNDIQWIELFNSSKTQTVALDTGNGWELVIENYNDLRSNEDPLNGIINFKNSGTVKTIPPRQTVLIVSVTGRNSNNVYKRSNKAHFVPTRVFDVYAELATEFGMRTRRDPFLHPTKGFHIQLVDGRGGVVDEIGNLDGRIRSNDEPTWRLPSGWTETDDRTSIIRRYRKDAAYDGTQRTGWIPAAETSFLYLSRKRLVTWYGLSTDHGSPGIRAGGELPVELSQFRPDRTETGTVVIHWATEAEVDNAGFNILRGQTRTGEFKVINAQLIPGAGTTAERNTYTWTDTTAKPNLVYYYQIEDVSLDGERQTLATVRLRGLVSAKGKLATQWGQLKRSRD